ncbi:hypothetical protein [Limnoglobus roseus]|uniref:Uncharacterized protein n=1 Tax=Limnoglobus roseus TaxID=2598579 RepID=A0A5C1AJ58_9BACT|nr:hypothetical protein [Limnoglobus roseus]QEL17154.1 hypothetical protein PX52LOC_04135 [Limnoglobus roseus]
MLPKTIASAAVDAATFRRSLNRMVHNGDADRAAEITAHRIAEGELMVALGRDTPPTAEELVRLLPPGGRTSPPTFADLALIPDDDLDEMEAEDGEAEEIELEGNYRQWEAEDRVREAKEAAFARL